MRCQTLPLLALAAVLAVLPSCNAISCYYCSDQQGGLGEEGNVLVDLPTCTEFDEDDAKYQQQDCGDGKTCSKFIFENGQVVRSCFFKEREEGCTQVNGLTECFCSNEFCNSAGLATPALLLLPAAVLTALL